MFKVKSLFTVETAVWVLVFLVFLFRGVTSLDPDFGWHIREGEIILSQGFLKTDLLSYTMGGFPRVDTEWLTKVIMVLIYGRFGMWGLSFLFSAIAVGAMMLSLWGEFRETKVRLSVLLLTAAALWSFFGVRAQVITWIFWAGLARLLLDRRRWLRWRYFVPPAFLLWANLHGGYMAGLGAMAIFLVLESARTRRVDFRDGIVFGFSTLATLINPYGLESWLEVWRYVHLSGLSRWYIMEWLPSVFFLDVPLVVLEGAILAFVWKSWRRFSWPVIVLFVIFSYLALASARHVPLWIFLGLPMVSSSMSWFLQEIAVDRIAKGRFGRMSRYFLMVALLVCLFQIWSLVGVSGRLGEQRFYPQAAVRYLRAHLLAGQIISEYGWGGYLDWKLPEKRVFIDGRMDVWEWQGHLADRSENIFREYLQIVSGEEGVAPVFGKYGVDTVLWSAPGASPRPELGSKFGVLGTLFEKWFSGRPQETFLDRIAELGWKEVYRDDVAVIYEKP